MANSIERTGKIFMGGGLSSLENEELMLGNALRKKKEEDEVKEAGQKFLEARKTKQAEIEAKLSTLEMLSVGPKVIILPYAENPYTKFVSDGGNIIIPTSMNFKNPETGEIEKPQNGIMCAKVIEVGPEVKYLKEGDDIYYDDRTAIPIPFFMQGYKVIAELNALTVINSGLKKRYNME